MRMGRTFILVILLSGVAGVGWRLLYMLETGASDQASPQQVVINRGESVSAVARRLEGFNIIRSRFLLKIANRIWGRKRTIKAGEYELSPSMSPHAILDTLVARKVKLHTVVIPEGLRATEIGALLEAKGIVNAAEFAAETVGTSAIGKKLGMPENNMEGYLFPETYALEKGQRVEDILRTMVEEFNDHFQEDWQKRAAEMGMSIQEAVTLASLIEKETGDPAERPWIASVFHNRLRNGMKLQCDPTVIYGIANFDGNITRKDLLKPHPWNTYVIGGLPPTPIANPGAESLRAALWPADTDYLYFVSRNDGTHLFSETYAAHARAVRRFQKGEQVDFVTTAKRSGTPAQKGKYLRGSKRARIR